MRRPTWSRWLLGLSLAVTLAPTLHAQASRARQVAAPASDIVSGLVRLPDPAAAPTVSRAAVLQLHFARDAGDGWTADVELPIDRGGDVTLALLSPDAGRWQLLVGPNAEAPRPIAEVFGHERRIGPALDARTDWIVDRYDLHGVTPGRWHVRVRAPESGVVTAPAAGWLVAKTESELRVEAYVSTHRLVSDQTIAVLARVHGSEAGLRVESARVVFEGERESHALPMHDDGQHEDAGESDGLLGALVPASLRGRVRARVEVLGITSTGTSFLRTAQLGFPVIEPRVLLAGSVQTSVLDERRLQLAIDAIPLGSTQRFHVSAEVWGSGEAGEAVPVCWLSRQADPEERDGLWSLALELDVRWIALARARTPIELRAVRVQDPETEVVFDSVDRMPLEIAALPPAATQSVGEATPEMLTGSAALTFSTRSPAGPHTPVSPTAFHPALMLVHGYCSGGSVWPAVDFTQPKLEFLDPNANRTHDQFAQLLDQRAQQAGLTSFGVVAHSQGGAAALHLFTYYQSALDLASGGRRIQSVATPYQGTPLASLGAFACGVNNDMTPAGAATWLAGIPSWARAEVSYWTTSDAGSACNFLTSLFLTDPEDGTVEKFRGELPGGNAMGHVTGWCHTTGMSYPANYTDHARNQAMNAAAAR